MATIATFYDHVMDIASQQGLSGPQALERARELGVELLEVSVNNAKERPEELAQELAGAGLGISSMPSYFDFGRNRDVEGQIDPVLDLAQRLGARLLLVIPGFTEGPPQEAEDQAARMAEAVARLGERAEKAGLQLTMEDFDNRAAPFSTSRGMLRFLEACPQLTACFDTGNFRFMAEDELSAYQALRGKIGHVHLKDRAFAPVYGSQGPAALDGQVLYPCPVGYGEIRMEELVAGLKADGYEGVYTIEHYGAADMLDCLEKSIQWTRERI